MKDPIVDKLYKETLRVMILSTLINVMASIIDSFVVSRFLGEISIAAIGVVYPYTVILTAVNMIFASGSQIICSKHMGNGDMKNVNSTFSSILMVLIPFSVAILTGTLIFIEPVSRFCGASASVELLEQTKKYISGIAIGVPGNLLMLFLAPMLQLDGDRKRVKAGTISMMLTNLVGNVVFVLVFKMDILGIGIATAISYYVGLALMLTHFLSKSNHIGFSFRLFSIHNFLEVLSSGAVCSIKKFMSAGLSVFMNNILASYGIMEAMAAFSLYKQTKNLFLIFVEASAATVLLMSGMLYAEKDRRGLHQLFLSNLKYGVISSALVGVILFIFVRPVYGLFVSGKTLDYVVYIMRLTAVLLPIIALRYFYVSYFQGIQRKLICTILSICGDIAFSVIMVLILSPIFGIDGVWWGFCSMELTIILIVIMMFRERKKSLMDTLLFIPEDFGGKKSRIFDVTINKDTEYSDILIQVSDFCDENRLPIRLGYFVFLAVEELVTNIIEYGFKDKNNHIDLRIVTEEDEGLVRIRIRDNCFAFNPKEKYELEQYSDDISENVGIRIINKLASRIEYVNVMSLNSLIIEMTID